MRKNFFITVEGGEGVGKSTCIAFMNNFFTSLGHAVVLTREPGGTPFSEKIRELVLAKYKNVEKVHDLTELLLIFASRAQHLNELIIPSITHGKTVLCDRFTDTSYAYQCAGRGLPEKWVDTLISLCHPDLKPDLTILLDAPVEVMIDRLSSRVTLDRIESEKIDFFSRIRERYLSMAKKDSQRYRVINAAQPIDSVKSDIEKNLQVFVDEHTSE